jgi:hypothetical protein
MSTNAIVICAAMILILLYVAHLVTRYYIQRRHEMMDELVGAAAMGWAQTVLAHGEASWWGVGVTSKGMVAG